MREDERNLRFLCPECSQALKGNFAHIDPEMLIGKHVKAAFRTTDRSYDGEHMWVKVKRVENDILVGNLDNIPAFCDDLKLGQEVKICLEDVEDIVIEREETI